MSAGNGKEQDTRRRRASTGRRMEAIMELARGLPLTRQVLADSLEDATAAQMAFMEAWMRELGLAMNITDCGAMAEDLENYADACPINNSGYVTLTRQDVIEVLRKSL